jgi:hypothetical protein
MVSNRRAFPLARRSLGENAGGSGLCPFLATSFRKL